MLYINGKKASKLLNILHAIYHIAKDIKRTIIIYNKCAYCNSNYIDNLLENYNELVSPMIDSMRYRIIVGMGNLFDNSKNSLSINKMLNLSEQEGKVELNKVVKKYRKEFDKFNDLIKNIKLLRDKMYAHIEISYSLESEEIFDIDFDFLNELLHNSLSLLNLIIEMCVEISINYDNNSLFLSNLEK